MLEDFDFRSARLSDQLTGRMATLANYQGLRVPVDYFEEAMARLRSSYLNVPLTAVLHPISQPAQQAAQIQLEAAASAPPVQHGEFTAQQYFERAFESTKPHEQIDFYSQAILLNPEIAEAFANRGLLRALQGDGAGAREDYDTAIRLKPHLAEALYNRSVLRDEHGDREGAREDHDEAFRLKSSMAHRLTSTAPQD